MDKLFDSVGYLFSPYSFYRRNLLLDKDISDDALVLRRFYLWDLYRGLPCKVEILSAT